MKLDVITLEVITKGFSTQSPLVGLAQNIKESNNFGVFVVKGCTMKSSKVRNAVLLNHSTNSVSCYTTCNFTTTINYLRGT